MSELIGIISDEFQLGAEKTSSNRSKGVQFRDDQEMGQSARDAVRTYYLVSRLDIQIFTAPSWMVYFSQESGGLGAFSRSIERSALTS